MNKKKTYSIINLSCPGVGIGRQAGLRSQCPSDGRGGSNPLLGTQSKFKLIFPFLVV